MSKTENTGGSVSYYTVEIECPRTLEPYSAECGDITDALEMNVQEFNMFKEIWRTAAARLGRKKKGHTDMYSAEKINFFSARNLQLTKFRANK